MGCLTTWLRGKLVGAIADVHEACQPTNQQSKGKAGSPEPSDPTKVILRRIQFAPTVPQTGPPDKCSWRPKSWIFLPLVVYSLFCVTLKQSECPAFLLSHHHLLTLEFLLGNFLLLVLLFGFGNSLFSLGQDHLDMAWTAHVRWKKRPQN